jgi:hypothetical protein
VAIAGAGLRVGCGTWMPAELRTAADVERLTPNERQRLINERTSTDLSQVSDDFVVRARSDGRRLLIEHNVIDADHQ